MKLFYKILILAIVPLQALALDPETYLQDEKDEARARMIFVDVKCLVCEAQSVASSDTEFSFKMRELIRAKILEGKSDAQIKRELVDQFGDEVLLSPLLNENNIAIWMLPFLFAALLGFGLFYRRKIAK